MKTFLFVLQALLTAITLNILWRWFVSPTFNLPLLSLKETFGIILFIEYLFFNLYKSLIAGNSEIKSGDTFYSAAVSSAIVLVLGGIIHACA